MERVLSLDISSKTGWACLLSGPTEYSLLAWGTLTQIHKPDVEYPKGQLLWADMIYTKIAELIGTYKPDVIVIEETVAGSKEVYSQKLLEWIHMLVARYIVNNNIKVRYFLTGEWRRIVGCLMTKDEKKQNKNVKTQKEKTGTRVAKDANGKRIGKITKKHVNIRRANEIFGKMLPIELRKKDEDTADALLLCISYHLRKTQRTV